MAPDNEAGASRCFCDSPSSPSHGTGTKSEGLCREPWVLGVQGTGERQASFLRFTVCALPSQVAPKILHTRALGGAPGSWALEREE